MQAITADETSGLVVAVLKFSMSPGKSGIGWSNSVKLENWPRGLVTPYKCFNTPLMTISTRASEGRLLDVVIARLIYLSRPKTAIGYPRLLLPPDTPFPKDHSYSPFVRDPYSSAKTVISDRVGDPLTEDTHFR